MVHTLNTNTEGVSIRFGYACVALYICMHVQPAVGGWGGSKCCAVWQSVEIGTSMCAFECDSARHEGIMTVCESVYVCVLWTHSEVNKYWQWIISSGRVAGGFDGADRTEIKRKNKKKVHVHVYTPLLFYIFPFSAILNFSRILESPWARHWWPVAIN